MLFHLFVIGTVHVITADCMYMMQAILHLKLWAPHRQVSTLHDSCSEALLLHCVYNEVNEATVDRTAFVQMAIAKLL